MSQNHNYNLRDNQKIDYKALHNTGHLGEIDSNSSDTDNDIYVSLTQESDNDNDNITQENDINFNEISNILTQLSLIETDDSTKINETEIQNLVTNNSIHSLESDIKVRGISDNETEIQNPIASHSTARNIELAKGSELISRIFSPIKLVEEIGNQTETDLICAEIQDSIATYPNRSIQKDVAATEISGHQIKVSSSKQPLNENCDEININSNRTVNSNSAALSTCQLMPKDCEQTCISNRSTEMPLSNQINAMDREFIKMFASQQSMRGEIVDYVDENPIDDLISIEDIDTCVNKIQELRGHYRRIHDDIKLNDTTDSYETSHAKEFNETMQGVKQYMIFLKTKKTDIQRGHIGEEHSERMKKEHKDREEENQKIETSEFLITEVGRLLKELYAEIDEYDSQSDEELCSNKEKAHIIQSSMNRLSDKFQRLLAVVPVNLPNKFQRIEYLKTQYDELAKMNTKFQKRLQSQIQARELKKEESFKSSSLNIKLPKFKGYESQMDIYIFQSDFEKLHLPDTPTRLLPDLLKNNYLEDPSLSFVKRFDQIDEIWVALKKAYGDPRIMLNKKLSEVKAITPLWRMKDSERLKESLSKMINAIDELLKLARRHKIEEKLYNGDGLYTIYGILGDARVTRWLNSIDDQELEGEELWKRLIKYLEKEVRVHSEKSMINRVVRDAKEPSQTKEDSDRPSKGKHHAHLTDKINFKLLKCYICNADDHVATNGPYGTKLIQYFSCQKFAEMNPSQRFAELKSKNLCHQCLYPGADCTKGKHKDGS